MKKILIIIGSLALALQCAFALKLETPSISGANFTVRGKNNLKVSAFTNETTIASVTSLFENRGWRYKTFNYHAKADDVMKLPDQLLGLCFYQLPFGADFVYEFNSDGEIAAIVTDEDFYKMPQTMSKLGFKRVEKIKPFRFFGMGDTATAAVYYKKVKKGETLESPKPWIILAGLTREKSKRNGETLYNGIVLPRQWPPDYSVGDKYFDPSGLEPMPVPYLEHKPRLINISVGRQLFVDDFLIAKGDFKREFHQPKKFDGNPVLKPETELEKGKPTPFASQGLKTAPATALCSGGLWWNEQKGVYQVWYNASWHGTLAYAYTKDFANWERPNLGIFGDSNQVFPDNAFVDSGAAFYDPYEPDPAKRYKNFNIGGTNNSHAKMWYSSDGANFDYFNHISAGISAERSTMFYNPFRKKWIFSLRWHSYSNHRCYVESDDFTAGADWLPNEPVYWLRADKNDKPIKKFAPQARLYNTDCIAYESLIVGFYDIWYGPGNDVCLREGHPKYTSMKIGYSRDGFHFSRPDYRDFIPFSKEAYKWDRGYVQSVNGGITVHGDEMRIWYVAGKGFGKGIGDKPFTVPELLASTTMHGNISLGYASMRRDGFVSLNSKGDKPAEVLTEPVQFAGSYLFVNADAPQGAVSVQIEDMDGKPIPPFTFENCKSFKGDSTRSEIVWEGAKNLGRLAYLPVRFRFKIENGKLYSFWVSVAKNGRSDGYLGAGMPGCPTPVDTIGNGE